MGISMSMTTLQVAGQLAFGGALVVACVGSYFQVLRWSSIRDERRTLVQKDFRQSAMYAVVLALAQVALLVVCYMVPGFASITSVIWFYLVSAVTVPFLWTAGKAHQRPLGWPLRPLQFSMQKKLAWVAGLAFFGVAGSSILFALSGAQPGAAIESIKENAHSTTALAIMVIWLMINAPWIEELVFRHYLLSALARWLGGGKLAVAVAVLATALLFAIGHAAHMQPVWPKMMQVTVWGIALGYVRVYLGTPYSILLHLVWNLSAPFIALSLS